MAVWETVVWFSGELEQAITLGFGPVTVTAAKDGALSVMLSGRLAERSELVAGLAAEDEEGASADRLSLLTSPVDSLEAGSTDAAESDCSVLGGVVGSVVEGWASEWTRDAAVVDVAGMLADPSASRAVLDRDEGMIELAPLKNVPPAPRSMPAPPPVAKELTLVGYELTLTLRFLLSIALTHSFFQMVSSSFSLAQGYILNVSFLTIIIRRGDNALLPLVPCTFDETRSSLLNNC